MKINSYEDLEIWQLGMNLLMEVYRVVASLPDRERFGLVVQMSRAAVSIPSNIAEGWGRGRGAAQANFVKVARGSLFELATHLEAARRLGYITATKAFEMKEKTDELGKKINAYLSWLEGSMSKKDQAIYGVIDSKTELSETPTR